MVSCFSSSTSFEPLFSSPCLLASSLPSLAARAQLATSGSPHLYNYNIKSVECKEMEDIKKELVEINKQVAKFENSLPLLVRFGRGFTIMFDEEESSENKKKHWLLIIQYQETYTTGEGIVFSKLEQAKKETLEQEGVDNKTSIKGVEVKEEMVDEVEIRETKSNEMSAKSPVSSKSEIDSSQVGDDEEKEVKDLQRRSIDSGTAFEDPLLEAERDE
jgi:hypothetical protein